MPGPRAIRSVQLRIGVVMTAQGDPIGAEAEFTTLRDLLRECIARAEGPCDALALKETAQLAQRITLAAETCLDTLEQAAPR